MEVDSTRRKANRHQVDSRHADPPSQVSNLTRFGLIEGHGCVGSMCIRPVTLPDRADFDDRSLVPDHGNDVDLALFDPYIAGEDPDPVTTQEC
jgi:hypothetical protein